MVMRLPERDQLSVAEKKCMLYCRCNGRKNCRGDNFGHDKPTGASSDIDMVTKMAKNMVTKYGMSTELGTVAYGENKEGIFR